jgi:signal transduction histidine kinase
MSGTLRQVDVIGSYLPVQDQAGSVIGVVEIYDNVSQLAGAIRETRWQIMGLSAGLLLALYLALLAIVGRADRILRDKAQALEHEVAQRTRIADELQQALKSTETAQRATERAYASAVAARRDAEAASVARSEFLQTTNEALRTPINAAIGMIDVLQTSVQAPLQREQLASLREQLLALLDRLSDAIAQAGRAAASRAAARATG